MASNDVQDQDNTALASKSLLLDLAEELVEWKFLGRHLGLTEGQLDNIERNNGESKERKYQTLLQWRTSAQRPTIGCLAKALKKVGRADLAVIVMQDATPPDGSSQGPNPLQGAEGGDPSPVATPPEGSGLGPSPPQGAEGGDPSPGITSESSTNQEGMTSGPEADGETMKLNGSQLQFSNAAIGNELITEGEINDVADEVYKHYGTYITSVDRFCSKLGMNGKDYRRVLEETKSRAVQDQLFYAIVHWHEQQPQTKEAFRKSLSQVHEQLGISYVRYVNNDQLNDQQ